MHPQPQRFLSAAENSHAQRHSAKWNMLYPFGLVCFSPRKHARCNLCLFANTLIAQTTTKQADFHRMSCRAVVSGPKSDEISVQYNERAGEEDRQAVRGQEVRHAADAGGILRPHPCKCLAKVKYPSRSRVNSYDAIRTVHAEIFTLARVLTVMS